MLVEDYNAFVVNTDEVSYNIRFDAFKNMIDADNVDTRVLQALLCSFVVHWDNYLFAQWALCGHDDARFGFTLATNEFLNLFNFICSKDMEKSS